MTGLPQVDRVRGLLFACILCAVLRLPSFLYGVISDDEAIYHAMASTLAAGGVVYRDTVDHKPPGIAWTYMLAQRVASALGADAMTLVHLAGLVVAVATCVALYGLGQRTLDRPLWSLPPLLYALASASLQPADGLAVNGELLLNLPSALCAWCALAAGPFYLDVLAGIFASVAVLYKYQAACVLVALPAVWLLDGDRGRWARRALWTACGVALPLLGAAMYFQAHGALGDALAWGIWFNWSYLAQGPPFGWALSRLELQLLGVVLPSLLLYAGGLVGLWRIWRRDPRQDLRGGRAFVALWAGMTLLTVGMGGRFFGHYFLQSALPLALLAAGPVSRLYEARPRLVRVGLFVPAVAFFAVAVLPPIEHLLFHPRDVDFARIGAEVERRTSPRETIWVWGNVPQIYYASKRVPGVRFSFCNYLTGLSPGTPAEYDPKVDPRAQAVPWAWPLALQDLERCKPALVLDTAAAGIKSYGKFPIAAFPLLARYLASHYCLDGEVAGVLLYRRVR